MEWFGLAVRRCLIRLSPERLVTHSCLQQTSGKWRVAVVMLYERIECFANCTLVLCLCNVPQHCIAAGLLACSVELQIAFKVTAAAVGVRPTDCCLRSIFDARLRDEHAQPATGDLEQG